MKKLPIKSIRSQAIVLVALLMIIPALIVGSAGILYYRNVIKNGVWENNLGEARSLSKLTTSYISLSITYLESIASRPLVIKAIEDKNLTFLDYTTNYTKNNYQFYEVYITDKNGIVLSHDPFTNLIDMDYSYKPYLKKSLKASNISISDALKSDVTGMPTIYLSVPVNRDDGEIIGVLVGALDLESYSKYIIGNESEYNQYVYLVNSTGHIMLHNNKTLMDSMADFSSVPGIKKVLDGEEGTIEHYNSIEKDIKLASFAPIEDFGWGVVIAVPIDVAYRSIQESTNMLTIFYILLSLLSFLLAAIIGKHIVDPIVNISKATKEMPDFSYDKYSKTLPLRREDELGDLARSFIGMAETITDDRDKITSEKNRAEMAKALEEEQRKLAESERARAELYVDIMGHDINNINQVAMGYLEMALDKLQAEGKLEKDDASLIEKPLASIENSIKLIQNVKKLQKIKDKDLLYKAIDVCHIIEDVRIQYLNSQGREVKINFNPACVCIVKSNELLLDVFSNLIGNAIKHSPADKQLIINIHVDKISEYEKEYCIISIDDNGPGINDDRKKELFKRFKTGGTSTKGTGLGLYLVKTIVESFDGKVWIEDRVPGDHTQGSKFMILLPAIEDQ